ncbi:hypothetical protein M758_7G024300 [Ceratodon purpureus]|nr:hypothetical protein M758_7G024300 [Ceratodon purpureus]
MTSEAHKVCEEAPLHCFTFQHHRLPPVLQAILLLVLSSCDFRFPIRWQPVHGGFTDLGWGGPCLLDCGILVWYQSWERVWIIEMN